MADEIRERTIAPHISPAIHEGVGGGGINTPGRDRNTPRYLSEPKFDVLGFVSTDFFTEAENRYQETVERRNSIRDAWEAEGAPLLTTGSTGQLVEHPYVRMFREHDLLVDRLGAVIRKRHRGRQPSAVVTPSPAARLRAVR